MEIVHPQRHIEERIKELCSQAATAEDSKVPALLEELKELLAEHSQFVRYLTAKTLNRVKARPSKEAA